MDTAANGDFRPDTLIDSRSLDWEWSTVGASATSGPFLAYLSACIPAPIEWLNSVSAMSMQLLVGVSDLIRLE